MPKKIYDINPPKIKKTKKIIKEEPKKVSIKKKAPPVYVPPVQERSQEQPIVVKQENYSANNYSAVNTSSVTSSKKKPIFIGVLVILIIFGIYLFFKLPKADVIIWPKVETLSYQQTITADKAVSSIDVTNATIPAQYFQVSKTVSQDFPATGNASNEGLATGTITLYNKYDPPESFTFKAGTRFMSDSGKLFVALQKVVIPAAKKSGSKITPGSVKIQVQATEAGSSYNIAASNFSVPGLKGTSYYYSVYGASTTAMTGGYTGKVKKVTDDDIQEAKEVLTKKVTSDAMSDLKSQISSDYILLDNAALSNVTDSSTETKTGAIVDNFTYKVTVQASAVAFKKADIDQFSKNYIISQIPEGKTLLDNTFKNNYSASVVDVSGGKATINLECSSGVYQNIDKNSVALSLLGENESQINETLNNRLGDQVSKIKVKFWPFWVSSAPNNQKAINVDLKFE